jgi:hypothetical protein
MAVNCMGPLVACNQDCLCAQSLNGFYQCVAAGVSAFNSATMFLTVTPYAQTLAQCAGARCQGPCGL